MLKASVIILLTIVVLASLLIAMADYSMSDTEKKRIQSFRNVIVNQTYDLTSVEHLPLPVKSYFEYAIDANHDSPGYVRIDQTGHFRFLKEKSEFEEDEGWHSLSATQCFSINPIGFYWFARIKMNALLWMRGWDSYDAGKGGMHWRANSLIRVMDAEGEKLDEGSLYRYLAEAVWFPTALLPRNGVVWQAIDDHSAEATLEDGNSKATVKFYFNDQHQIYKMSARRFRESNGEYVKSNWHGYYSGYKKVNGFNIPFEGEVSWEMPLGEMKYVKIRVNSIVYQ